MRRRPAQTVSERELVCALGKTGRQVGLSDLIAWRRAGLLPPFASCGTGAGRSYYWCEADIQERAGAVYDALARCGRIDSALITIWLAGFDAPLERLRRAMLHRLRIRAASEIADKPNAAPIGQALGALMELTHPDGAHSGRSLQDIRSQSDLRGYLDRMSLLYRPLTENITLLQRSSAADLLMARHYLLALSADPERAAKTAPAPEMLFLFLLALVRSGRSEILQKIDAVLPRPAWQSQPMENVRAIS